MDKLKPCPFCGEVPALYEKAYNNYIKIPNEYWVSCHNCSCRVAAETDHFNTEQEAIEAWNTRKGEEE